jgi:hypothetical protein
MSANVQSTDAIERLRLAVLKFSEQCELGLEEIEGETRRMLDWFEHDRPKFWRQQIHQASDDVHQAKINLERCLRYTVGQERPSCREERAALKAAQNRLDYCQDKAERVKHWCREIQHELLEYQGRVGQLASCTEYDLPQAATRLKRILDQIAAYQSVGSGGSGKTAAPTAKPTSPVRREIEEPGTESTDAEPAPTDSDENRVEGSGE